MIFSILNVITYGNMMVITLVYVQITVLIGNNLF